MSDVLASLAVFELDENDIEKVQFGGKDGKKPYTRYKQGGSFNYTDQKGHQFCMPIRVILPRDCAGLPSGHYTLGAGSFKYDPAFGGSVRIDQFNLELVAVEESALRAVA